VNRAKIKFEEGYRDFVIRTSLSCVALGPQTCLHYPTARHVYLNHTCCVPGANGPFPAANKDALRRLAEANIEVHEYTADHPDEVAQWYFDNRKPPGLI
jgi:hypothetical protein